MVDMEYWLGKKYDILAKQAEGAYQKDIADAKSLPGSRADLGFTCSRVSSAGPGGRGDRRCSPVHGP